MAKPLTDLLDECACIVAFEYGRVAGAASIAAEASAVIKALERENEAWRAAFQQMEGFAFLIRKKHGNFYKVREEDYLRLCDAAQQAKEGPK